ncbi:hypothetical protein ACEN8K_46270, partial [Variovorax sp. CT11-76]
RGGAGPAAPPPPPPAPAPPPPPPPPPRAEFEGDALAWRVRARTGVQWSEWGTDELRRQEPDLDARYTLGIHVGEAGHCRDPGAYVAALAAHA